MVTYFFLQETRVTQTVFEQAFDTREQENVSRTLPCRNTKYAVR